MPEAKSELTGADIAALVTELQTGGPGAVTKDVNRRIVESFRAHDGVVAGELARIPLVLVTVTGARSGRERTVPLAFVEMEDRLFVVASTGGADANPAWYDSMVADPAVQVEIGAERYAATAVVLEGAERERIFSAITRENAGFADYQTRTSREIPVVELRRRS